ncbi:hypothetical protein GUJ93_ZPchr0013g35147 [Zizania palustris]|uniref:Uncharacterized protein n=1 Tax=Zizania palustris TaxID=103762 RepID=A0A8J6C3N9_ZIZPA|nr:hypothetical protein GUJ93_ZPchr0013g35147 [Zizania palustris]
MNGGSSSSSGGVLAAGVCCLSVERKEDDELLFLVGFPFVILPAPLIFLRGSGCGGRRRRSPCQARYILTLCCASCCLSISVAKGQGCSCWGQEEAESFVCTTSVTCNFI